MLKLFEFLEKSADLKSTLRYVYLQTGRQESSAEHSWQLSLMVPMLIDLLKLDLDINKSVNLALIHDLPEAITGDIDAISIMKGEATKEQKQILEAEAMESLQNLLPESLGNKVFALWHEYEMAQTEEAKFVKALDKLETTFQLTLNCQTLGHIEFLVTYPDPAVRNYPALLPLLKVIKTRLKAEFINRGLKWSEDFNYGL